MRTPILWVSLALALPACAQTEVDRVRARAATQYHCDPKNVTVRKTATPFPRETLYEASACGNVTVYRCTRPVTDDLQSSMPMPEYGNDECVVDAPPAATAQ